MWSFTTIAVTPSAPTLASPANGATGVATSPTLSWNASTGATSYTLQVSTSSDFSTLVLNQTGIVGTSYAASSLLNNTTYYWRVNATNAGGTSAWSSVWSFTTIVAAPLAPTLALPANGATGVAASPTLSWNISSGATSYALQVSTSSDFSTLVLNQTGIGSTSYAVSSLLNNTTYYWRVNATNAGGTSAWSSVWSFTTVVAAPSAPTLALPANGATGVAASPTLSWNISSGATSYTLQVSTSSDFSTLVVNQTGIISTSYAVSLLNNTTYYWRVNATNAGGTSGWSSVWSFATAVATSVEEIAGSIPTTYALKQNFPNPFNPTTKVQFDIPQACTVTLKVYTLLGKEVATLVSEELQAGSYKVEWDARGVPSGVYLCRMFAGSLGQTTNAAIGSGQTYVETKKLVLIK